MSVFVPSTTRPRGVAPGSAIVPVYVKLPSVVSMPRLELGSNVADRNSVAISSFAPEFQSPAAPTATASVAQGATETWPVPGKAAVHFASNVPSLTVVPPVYVLPPDGGLRMRMPLPVFVSEPSPLKTPL